MKIIHLSDLHLGKRVNGFSMLPDQKFILQQILEIIRSTGAEAVAISGDVYDKSIPPAEAVELFDWFLTELSGENVDVFVISGNHDSAERIAFGASLFRSARIYVSPVYDGSVTCIEKEDAYGTVCFHLLPFLKPVHVRGHFPDSTIETYSDALETALSVCDLNPEKRHILLTHQLVTGAERSESEDISVGGSDNVDAQVFAGFDYVALGHLHRPQNVGANLRYCGTPLKYSFSEANHEKSVTVLDLKEKGNCSVQTIPLQPLHDMRRIRGTYLELTARSYYQDTDLPDCYLDVTLTDEEDIPDAIGRLRAVYPLIMNLDYDNRRTRMDQNPLPQEIVPQTSPVELFDLLYQSMHNAPMDQEDTAYIRALVERIWEEH
ncbi:MAG: exonuclease SbcCD subunit D [Oscillospiraceae bacterium]|nr:exonuclease SbcCD subunit D [Oscillospiraceae bacterium]MBR2889901.1 exonuclease SbcCD subunit D [Oscillospiraceae bacterium]